MLAEALRAARQRAGIKQNELARRCGLSQALISRLEAGKRTTAGFGTLERLAAGMGCRVVIAFEPVPAEPEQPAEPAPAEKPQRRPCLKCSRLIPRDPKRRLCRFCRHADAVAEYHLGEAYGA